MTDLLTLLGLNTEKLWLNFLNNPTVNIPEYPTYPQIIDEHTTGVYQVRSLDNVAGVTVYIWIRGKRTSMNFKNGILEYILTETETLVKV